MFLVGLFTGIVAFGINLAVENVAGLKFVYTVNLMTSERLVHTLVFPLLMLASLLLFLVSGFSLLMLSCCCFWLWILELLKSCQKLKIELSLKSCQTAFSWKSFFFVFGCLGQTEHD